MKAGTTIVCTAMAAALMGMTPTRAADTAPAASPARIPAEAFFNWEEMSEPVMAPDGSAIAVLVRNKAGRRQLAVIDTADLRRVQVVGSFEEFDIENARWVNNRRLVFSLSDESESAWHQDGWGLHAVDRDGENFRTLIRYKGTASSTGTMIKGRELAPGEYRPGPTLADGSDDVIVYRLSFTTSVSQLYVAREGTGTLPLRLNTRTGELNPVLKGTKAPTQVWRWAIDAQVHVLAGLSTNDVGKSSLYVPDESGDWHEHARFDSFGLDKDGFSLVSEVAADGTVLAEHATGDAAGGQALYRLDLKTGKPEAEPIVSVKGFDVDAQLVEDHRSHKLLGVHYEGDAGGTAWFDPAMKALQAKVDARLPGLINRIDPAECGCATRVLVTSASDHQPPVYFLYDRTEDTLIPIGAARRDISPRQMADTDFYRIKARDGNDLPVYVTKPRGKGPFPTVVLVHGGPWIRGWHWTWDPESQFLASRGYLVVKPEFRGSQGYGYALYANGMRQWGLTMQDDIADATKWAFKEGLADPARTCIAGASYGGYATLMGLVRYGDLYRCGVAWAAVSDINLMYDFQWSDASFNWRLHGMPELIGDQKKDAAQLEATSPLKQAAKITRPLLLAHGGVDRRVPIIHAVKMRDALESNRAPITWLEYKDEAHGWYKPSNRADFYTRMESFLAANIGPGAGAPVAAAAPAASAATH